MNILLITIGCLFFVDGVGSYIFFRDQPRFNQSVRVMRSVGALIVIIVGIAI
jgi:hypothetical protein